MPYTVEQLEAVLTSKLDAACEKAGTTTSDLMRAMEDAWNLCVRQQPAPDLIIANGGFFLAYRRAMRPAHRQVGGSSLRAVKRRAVRRPW